MACSISRLAELLGLPFWGDGKRLLKRVSSWKNADAFSLVFLESRDKAGSVPETTQAACVIAPQELAPSGLNVIFSPKPKLDFARAAVLLQPSLAGSGHRHPTAVIDPTADVAPEVDIGPHVTVGAGVQSGQGCVLHAGVVIGDGASVGENCILYPRVVLYPGAEIGNRVILHAGAAVGSDGFGYVFDGCMQVKFPQVGAVVLEDDVEIGANTTIDRGSLGVTRISAGAKIDNLVQIAHNVFIGKNVVIAAQTGVSGSTVIEDSAVIGGQVGFGDHARVQAGAIIGSKAGVLPGKIVRGGDVYWGVPVRPLREFKRLNALFGRLPEMKESIDRLKEEVARLDAALKKQEHD